VGVVTGVLIIVAVIEVVAVPFSLSFLQRRGLERRSTPSTRFGFAKSFPTWVFVSSEKAFGTGGAGRSFGFADPNTDIGFAYVMNRMRLHPWGDPRELASRQTLLHDILGSRPQT
jgi:CubicO group peptidase (beta-lactamase class C family)